MKKPNLFIVGAPRCATTSLANYLNNHKNVFFRVDVEPLYFAPDITDRTRVEGEKEYLDLFKKAGQVKWIGEKSAFYLYSESAVNGIKKFCPTAKILIILRDPIDQMVSWHNLQYRSAWNDVENIADFRSALEAEKSRKKFYKRKIHSLYYREIASYSKFVARWLEKFGKRNVHIILFEDLERNPEETYFKVLDFLNLEHQLVKFKAYQPGGIEKTNKLYNIIKLVNEHPKSFGLVKRLAPLRFRYFVRDKSKVSKREKLNKDFERKLRLEFIPEIEKLEKIINKDLKEWKTVN